MKKSEMVVRVKWSNLSDDGSRIVPIIKQALEQPSACFDDIEVEKVETNTEDAIQVFKRTFDTMENDVSDAINDTLLGTFTEIGNLSAHGNASKFIGLLPKFEHYLAYDGEVYPKIFIKNIKIN